MVEHDESRVQAWMQAREETREKEGCCTIKRLSVLAVQSVACCVVVLVALLLRVAGGDAYASLREGFQQALVRNEFVSAVMLMWDVNSLKTEEVSAVKEDVFTDEEAAQMTDSVTMVTALAPLVSGTVTSSYGQRIHPISGDPEFHMGVDIAAPIGTALWAVCDGVVTEVGENATLGKYVSFRSENGTEILYGHCNEILVMPEAEVKAGERIALVGSTGVSTGSHVHIRVSVDGVVCDPALLLPLDRYV